MRRRALLVLVGLLAAAAVAGCGGGGAQGSESGSSAGAESGGGAEGSGTTSSNDPIKVGAVASLTGPYVLSESTAAAQAVFDEVNAAGGIDGNMIEYVVADDGGTAQGAAQAARTLVDESDVVANVGSASILECAVNAEFYEQRGVLSVQGGSGDPVCYSAPNISPVDVGLFTSIGLLLQYAAEELGNDKVCAILHSQPGFAQAYEAVLGAFEERSGLELAYVDKDLGPTADPTPTIVSARRAGCEAVVFTGIGPQVIAIMKSVEAQGLEDEITWLTTAAAYTTDMPQALGSAGEGLYANSQFELLDADVPAVREWAALMSEHNVPINSFSQGGYLAAQVFVEALRSIEGSITRESVTEALHGVTAFESPLMGTPYSFAPAERHGSNVGSRIVQLGDGAWQPVSDGFYQLDQ